MSLEKKNKKILIVCPHPEGVAPGQRLKYEQYFDSWRASGYELTISPFMSRRFWQIVYRKGHWIEKILWTIWGYLIRIKDLIRLPFYDGYYVFLWVTPFGFPIFERLFTRLNKKLIYDIDDMVFLGHVSDANKFILHLKGKSKMIYFMRKAKHVITCTPKLDEFVRQFNSKTTDISSTINTETYQAKKEADYQAKSPIVLGWSGSHSTSKYLHLLDRVLREVSGLKNIKLRVIGDAEFEINGVEVEAMEWRRESEVKDLSQIDIGLYPLPNEDWVYGKSGLKALQYMALGIPTIATDIGANKRVISDSEDGFLVNSEKEWVERILNLIENVDLRRKIGQNARQKVETQFSIKANQKKYLNILNQVYQ